MQEVKFWQIKPEIRILGVDDGPPDISVGKVPLVGTIFRGGRWLDGVLKTDITPDGSDVTEKLVEMVSKSRHFGQLRVVMLDGVTFAGFNVLDVKKLFKELHLPVIVISREKPNMPDILKALKNLPDWSAKWKLIKKAGRIYPVKTKHRGGQVYMQLVGIRQADAEQIVKLSSVRSLVPEPIRAAHLIAAAIVLGESHGRV